MIKYLKTILYMFYCPRPKKQPKTEETKYEYGSTDEEWDTHIMAYNKAMNYLKNNRDNEDIKVSEGIVFRYYSDHKISLNKIWVEVGKGRLTYGINNFHKAIFPNNAEKEEILKQAKKEFFELYNYIHKSKSDNRFNKAMADLDKLHDL